MRRLSRVGMVSVGLVVVSSLAGGLLGARVVAGDGAQEEQLRLYTAILATVQREYVDEVPAERLVTVSIEHMLRGLDPHSNLLEPREHSQLQERQRGSYYGLGITVQSIDGNITVLAPFEGTPAHRLGLRAGDVISRIDGEDARGMAIDEAVKRLRGPKGSSVRVTIARKGYGSPLEFTVIRDEIALHSVPYYFMVTKRTGYVRLVDFNETTACRPSEGPTCEKELGRAIRHLQEQGATSLMLDIRDNPGGLLDQAFAVASQFLGKQKLVVFTRGRSRRDESTYMTEGESRYGEMPLVVLTSEHSASASEIVAGAIQDHDRGLIVGERTFGKGLVQTILPLHNVRGYALALTTARYYTPSGRSIQRDYGKTALEDYVAPTNRHGCEDELGEPKLTDAGRKVYGGDGIEPDFCVEPETPSKLLANLDSRRAFFDFAMLYESADHATEGEVDTADTRVNVRSSEVTLIHPDFEVTDEVLADFKSFLGREGIRFDSEELEKQRVAISRRILEEVLRQVFGEGTARRRSLAWDPQIQKGLEVIPQAETLLRSPQRYVAEHRRTGKGSEN